MTAHPKENAPSFPLQPEKAYSGLKPVNLLASIPSILTLVVAFLSVLLASLMLVQNTLVVYSVAALGALSVTCQLLFLDIYRKQRGWNARVGLISLFAFLSLLVMRRLPEYITGLQINGVLHRSLFAILFLMVLGILAMGTAIFNLLGATPSAEDLSHYPLILIPVVLALVVYAFLIGQLLVKGLPSFDPMILLKPYLNYSWPVKIMIDDGWPAWSSELRYQLGIANHILGTGMLMLLTSLISLPIGAGAGVYLSEYGDGRFGGLARFCISSLRAISTLILGLTALSLVTYSGNSPLAWILQGSYFDGYEIKMYGASFLAASLVLSLLIIPIITRATEEGCRSLPPELREGSLALGASEQTTLWRVVLPWAMPNIVTALLLGCAEAAGSVAVLLFVSGRGDYGVGIFRPVTSLAYLIFDIYYGEKSFRLAMEPYQFIAGLLLLAITMGLGITALLIKRWLVKRHRGG